MLDLQAGIHFHEIERAVLVGDEFDRAGADIADRLGRCHRRIAHCLAPRVGHARRRRFFQHFLVAPLHGAIALEQVDAVALGIGEHLDFDMARLGQVFFDQHLVVAEAADRFALARDQGCLEIAASLDDTHALAAAAGAGFEQDRIAHLVGLALQERGILVVAVVARHQRHVGFFHQRLGGRLGAHRVDRGGRRADEDHAGALAGAGEVLVLGQESVAGVDRLGAGGFGHLQDGLGFQVALARGRGADQHRFIAHGHMLGVGIRVGIYGDGLDAHAARSGGDAAGDFAAVGDQDLGEHATLSKGLGQSGGAARTDAAAASLDTGTTCGTRRNASPRPAHSVPPTGQATTPCACRPDRSRRRPIAARWRSRDGPDARIAP